jgi:uncharacterized protein (TIGR02246 family)
MLCVAAFVCLAAVPVYAQVSARLDIQAVTDALQEPAVIRAAYVAALNAADAESLQRLYASDAVVAFGDGRLVRGAELAARLRGAVAAAAPAAPARVTIRPLAFSRDGDLATERGVYAVSSGSAEQPQTVNGLYIVVYTRTTDGNWRIAMEVRSTGAAPSLVAW